MAQTQAFVEPRTGGAPRLLLIVGGAALALLLVWWLYSAFTAVEGVRVEKPSPTAIDMLPPPPPPPPPPPQLEEKPPEPVDAPAPVPEPAAAPKPDAPAPMQIDGPAQAGADAFGLSSGKGGGMGSPGSNGTCIGLNCGKAKGGGIADGFYRRYLSSALQQAISRDNRVNRLVFTADFEIVVMPDGRVQGVSLRRSSGKDDRDDVIKGILEAVRGLDPPPVAARYPVVITVRGRRQI